MNCFSHFAYVPCLWLDQRPSINIFEDYVGKKHIAIIFITVHLYLSVRIRNQSIMNMELFSPLAIIAVMLYIASVTSPASTTCIKVDDTTDKCRGSNLRINNKWYTKGSYGQIDLPYAQNDIYWYCGFSKERTGWGGMANRLSFYFSWDGTIFWVIYNCRR